jgi:hypothetical protein
MAKCERCNGCGQLYVGDDEEMPLCDMLETTAQSMRLGGAKVNLIPALALCVQDCPDCGGSGKHELEEE